MVCVITGYEHVILLFLVFIIKDSHFGENWTNFGANLKKYDSAGLSENSFSNSGWQLSSRVIVVVIVVGVLGKVCLLIIVVRDQ